MRPIALSMLLLLSACPKPVCTAGQQVSCACPSSAPNGVQVCKSDGSGFGACTGCAGGGSGGGAAGGGGMSGGGFGGGSGGGMSDVPLTVAVVVETCSTTNDPYAGVSFLRVRIFGPDLAVPIETVMAKGPSMLTVQVPAGAQRVVEVRGYDQQPPAGNVLSMGRSVPFDTSQVSAGMIAGAPLNVFLRKTGAFTPVYSAANPGNCGAALLAPRAAHSATALKNGRVLLAGGWDFMSGTAVKEALYTTELYDPAKGTFTFAHEISIANGIQRLPRAFHASTLLPSGQVLFWGGESYSGNVNNVLAPSAILLIYDADEDNLGPWPRARARRRSPERRPRQLSTPTAMSWWSEVSRET